MWLERKFHSEGIDITTSVRGTVTLERRLPSEIPVAYAFYHLVKPPDKEYVQVRANGTDDTFWCCMEYNLNELPTTVSCSGHISYNFEKDHIRSSLIGSIDSRGHIVIRCRAHEWFRLELDGPSPDVVSVSKKTRTLLFSEPEQKDTSPFGRLSTQLVQHIFSFFTLQDLLFRFQLVSKFFYLRTRGTLLQDVSLCYREIQDIHQDKVIESMMFWFQRCKFKHFHYNFCNSIHAISRIEPLLKRMDLSFNDVNFQFVPFLSFPWAVNLALSNENIQHITVVMTIVESHKGTEEYKFKGSQFQDSIINECKHRCMPLKTLRIPGLIFDDCLKFMDILTSFPNLTSLEFSSSMVSVPTVLLGLEKWVQNLTELRIHFAENGECLDDHSIQHLCQAPFAKNLEILILTNKMHRPSILNLSNMTDQTCMDLSQHMPCLKTFIIEAEPWAPSLLHLQIPRNTHCSQVTWKGIDVLVKSLDKLECLKLPIHISSYQEMPMDLVQEWQKKVSIDLRAGVFTWR